MSHIDLQSYYELNFALVQFHKYSLTEIENWMPWERDLYVDMLKAHIETEKTKGTTTECQQQVLKKNR